MEKFYKLVCCLMLSGLVFTNLSTINAQNDDEERYQIKGNGALANPNINEFTQPDGSKLTMNLKGDAVLHWGVTPDGYTLLNNSEGYYVYATKDAMGNMVPSNIIAHNPDNRTDGELSFLATSRQGMSFSESQIKYKLDENQKDYALEKAYPAKGTNKYLVLLIGFSDVSFSTTKTDFENLMNQTNYSGIGSFKDFYLKNSINKLTVNTVVGGIYTAAHNMAYYGSNASGDDANVRELISEAITAAYNAGIDFSQFDNNGDHKVESVYIIYAGYGENAGGGDNTIWAHSSSISPVTYNGVQISKYACSAELEGNSGTTITGIGVICHEFAHTLGIPDFYDTDYSTNGQGEGTGTWDVMGNGNYNGYSKKPAFHNPWSRKFMNWVKINEITWNSAPEYVLKPAEEDSVFYRYTTKTRGEYFLLENRQKLSFDGGLNGKGMLIYHVDSTYLYQHFNVTGNNYNSINATASHQGLDIEEADNDVSNATIAGDPFPGNGNKTSFTDNTSPNSKSWANIGTAKPMDLISENTSTKKVSFHITGISGVDEIKTSKINLYPIFASDKINIQSFNRIEKIEVISENGQLVYTEKPMSEKSSVDVSSFSNSMYFVKIYTGNDIITKKFFIVK